MNTPIENESASFLTQQTRYRPSHFAFMALGVLFLLYQIVGGGITLLFIGGGITEDNVTAARLATMISQILFLLLPTIYLAKRQHGKLSDAFQWRIPGLWESILALAGMLALMQIAEIYLYLQSLIPLPEQFIPFIEAIKKAVEEAFKILIVAQSLPELSFVLLVAAITPALCEEMMFRGLIQKNLTLAYGSTRGYLFAGAIFGIYHMNPIWIVPLIGLGIYFSFIQHRSQTLILPIIAHLMNNTASTVGMYVYGNSDLSTPTIFSAGLSEPSMMAVLGTALFFVIVFSLIVVQYIRVTENFQNDYH